MNEIARERNKMQFQEFIFINNVNTRKMYLITFESLSTKQSRLPSIQRQQFSKSFHLLSCSFLPVLYAKGDDSQSRSLLHYKKNMIDERQIPELSRLAAYCHNLDINQDQLYPRF